MRKRVAGGTFIVAATLLSFPTQETIKVENSQVGNATQDEVAGVVVNRAPDRIPITLVETIDGYTIKVRVKSKI